MKAHYTQAMDGLKVKVNEGMQFTLTGWRKLHFLENDVIYLYQTNSGIWVNGNIVKFSSKKNIMDKG